MTEKQIGDERVCLTYASISQLIIKKIGTELKHCRNLKTAADAGATEQYCLLDCFPGFPSLLSNRTQGHQPLDCTTHNRLGPPLWLIKKMPYKLA